MKNSRILLTVMVLSSIVTFTHFVDADSASNVGFKIAVDRVGAKHSYECISKKIHCVSCLVFH